MLIPTVLSAQNSQTMDLLAAHHNIDPTGSPGRQLAIVDDSAISAAGDPQTFVDVGPSGNGQITTYIVRQGDSLGSIAQMFGVTTNTIIWANDIKSGKVSPGDQLVILPITGVKHTVKKGDTVQSIAKQYKADVSDILSYNGLTSDQKLNPGDIVIVPDGEISNTVPSSGRGGGSPPGSKNTCGLLVSHYERLLVNPCGLPFYAGYYIRPVPGGNKSQNLHGYNAVDIAAPYGTPIVAAAEGTVIAAKSGGWNGAYGSYVVISHPNGSQTLYGHMSSVLVSAGEHVSQGQLIGKIGMTGRTTGPHVHFEIRGAQNPF